jgi:diacylglycerol kinase family enzyme
VKRVFVINPKAGAGIGRRGLERLESYFRRRGSSFEAIVSRSREDVIQRTREALRAGAEQVVAVGGDGTVNAVANGFFESGELVRPGACLAVAQAGSGSDYFRGLTKTARHDWRDIVLCPVVRPVDVARVETAAAAKVKPLYFLNMATFGMSAEVVRRKASMSPLWPKSLRYLLPTVRGLFHARESRVRLTIDGQLLERDAFCIMVAKGTYSGGGMRFGSHVALDDGRFEVTLFRPMAVWKMLVKTPKLYSGELHNEPTIEKFTGCRIEIAADPPLLAEVDGDVIGDAAVSMTVLPQRIPVCFPNV